MGGVANLFDIFCAHALLARYQPRRWWSGEGTKKRLKLNHACPRKQQGLV